MSLHTTYFVGNQGLNVPFKVLNTDPNRKAVEIFNSGIIAADFVGVTIGDQRPDLTKFVSILVPYGSWWLPAGICMGEAIWLTWLSNNGASTTYVTEYK